MQSNRFTTRVMRSQAAKPEKFAGPFRDVEAIYAPYDGGVFFRLADLAKIAGPDGYIGFDKGALAQMLDIADEAHERLLPESIPRPIKPKPEGFKHALADVIVAA